MEKAPIGGVSAEHSTVSRGRSFDDIHSSHRRPLLADWKSTQPDGGQQEDTGPGYSRKLWRCQSDPGLNVPEAGDLQPPYKRESDYSMLFKAVVGVIVYFAVGILCSFIAEDAVFGSKTESSLVDALYFCVVTLTTVGYGDLVPGSTGVKLFICIYVFVGFSLVGAIVSGAANYIVEKQEQVLVETIKRKERNVEFEQSQEDNLRATEWKAFVSGLLVLSLFILGLLTLILVEGLSFVDAFYCVCVTVTTLGYGDNSFQTAPGRLFASVWILSSTVCVAQFFLYLAEVRTGERQLKLAHWVLHRRTTRVDLEAADLDGDGVVSAPEFVIFKLKELGKIDEEDIVGILREFRKLDYDHSGTINLADLALSQKS